MNDRVNEFANRIKGLGFRVFIAQSGNYGFITDDKAERVLTFSFTDGESLSGNYGPPSRESGTGWKMSESPAHLQTKADVKKALYAMPPEWCGKGWKRLTNVKEHLTMYGSSSKYSEV